MRIAKGKGVLSEELMSALIAFKEERDWLVHRSMNENGDDLYLNEDRQALFERLEEFAEQAKDLQNDSKRIGGLRRWEGGIQRVDTPSCDARYQSEERAEQLSCASQRGGT